MEDGGIEVDKTWSFVRVYIVNCSASGGVSKAHILDRCARKPIRLLREATSSLLKPLKRVAESMLEISARSGEKGKFLPIIKLYCSDISDARYISAI